MGSARRVGRPPAPASAVRPIRSRGPWSFDRGLICQLFWDGRCEDDLAREWGVSRQAISKGKQKILLELRRQVGMP